MLGPPAGSPALRSRVGYVTQSASVYTDLTGRVNVRYFASLYGVSRSAADRALADVGLGGLADQRVGTLSGGQRARVSLACAYSRSLICWCSTSRRWARLLMREGRLVANDSPAALRAATGAHDMNQAFLRRLIRGDVTAAVP